MGLNVSASFRSDIFPGWTRFRHGAFQCTVVVDGPIHAGPPAQGFIGAEARELEKMLNDGFLPTDAITLSQNLLVVNTGEKLVLFDSGCGRNERFGLRHFGSQVGCLIPNLRAAGIAPEEIDLVVLTHAHPDHSWGLADDRGERLFPNARVAVSSVEVDYWTDLSRVESVEDEHRKDQFRGAAFNLAPYRDRLVFVSDRTEVVPGITAIATPGHSIGHHAYVIESEGRALIHWGDLSHHQIILLQRPDLGFVFDYDQEQAIATRVKMFNTIASDRTAVFACHFPFPGRGHLRRGGTGFDWIASPIEIS
jgi:glyoxylase-like metal-dependent hydrolase (beta-lactamase superfamily II)